MRCHKFLEMDQDSLTDAYGSAGCKGADRAAKWSDPLKAGQAKTNNVEEAQVFTEVFRSTVGYLQGVVVIVSFSKW
jgi:hypothetical protein